MTEADSRGLTDMLIARSTFAIGRVLGRAVVKGKYALRRAVWPYQDIEPCKKAWTSRDVTAVWTALDLLGRAFGGRCWDRTSDLSRVKGALYH